jgi:hypothetical protein
MSEQYATIIPMNAGTLFDRMQEITAKFLAQAQIAKQALHLDLAGLALDPTFQAFEADEPDLCNSIVKGQLSAMVEAASAL